MTGTDSVSDSVGKELVTLWLCTSCLARHQTRRWNPRWFDLTIIKPIIGRHGKNVRLRHKEEEACPVAQDVQYQDPQEAEKEP